MADQIVIVTGSRALADSPEATRWAREILARELASATLVIAGDARGPDTWAHEIAQGFAAPIDCERWCVNGAVERRVSAVGWWRDDPWGTPETTTDPRRRPLVRNVAMIASCEGRADTRIVGLIDAASKTRGTQHTLSIARSGGFNVTQFVWGAS